MPDVANPWLNTLALSAHISQLAVAMMQNQGAWLDIDLRALKIEDFNVIGRKGEMQGVALFEIDRIARGCHAVNLFDKLYPRWRSPFIWRKRPAVMLSISGDRIARGEADPEIDPGDSTAVRPGNQQRKLGISGLRRWTRREGCRNRFGIGVEPDALVRPDPMPNGMFVKSAL